jgi:acetylglutamate kinase
VKVVKLGGSLVGQAILPVRGDGQAGLPVLQRVANEWRSGEELVLVHGGGQHIDAMLARLGMAKRTHAGLRITDDATLEIVVGVLGGMVNKLIVSELAALGVQAAGISGSDAGTLIAEPHPPIDGVELGHVGNVVEANPTLVNALLLCGVLPVVSSIAISKSGALLNVNADSAAAALAAALGARSLQFLTDVDGLLDAAGGVVDTLTPAGAQQLVADGVVHGGMLPKLGAALGAMRAGVGRVEIGATRLGDHHAAS